MLLLLLCLLLSCWAPSSPSPMRLTKSCPPSSPSPMRLTKSCLPSSPSPLQLNKSCLLSSPSPRQLTESCPSSSFLMEVIEDVESLQGICETTPPNNITLLMEKGEENPVVYLKAFIQALENSTMEDVTRKLCCIYDARKTCTGWLKHKWEPMEDYDFFKNLDELLRFLNTYNFLEQAT